MADPKQIERLFTLAHQIRMATEAVDKGQVTSEALLTSADLARLFGLERESVKKNLRILKDLGFIRTAGLSPKRYRFDTFQYKQFLQSEPVDELAQAVFHRLEAKFQDANHSNQPANQNW